MHHGILPAILLHLSLSSNNGTRGRSHSLTATWHSTAGMLPVGAASQVAPNVPPPGSQACVRLWLNLVTGF